MTGGGKTKKNVTQSGAAAAASRYRRSWLRHACVMRHRWRNTPLLPLDTLLQ